jgi:phosphonatase-like hydrolase
MMPQIFRLMHKSSSIKLLICDMVGTTVNEGGAVYTALYETIRHCGADIRKQDIQNHYGVEKSVVMRHFLKEDHLVKKANDMFEDTLLNTYFNEDIDISLINPKLPEYFNGLREHGIKVALNTGYSKNIQQAIIDRLDMNDIIDTYTCPELSGGSRPGPNMIYTIMETLNIINPQEVCKVGDTINDIYEGLYANCGHVVGVRSGVDTAEKLISAGAHSIVKDVTELEL